MAQNLSDMWRSMFEISAAQLPSAQSQKPRRNHRSVVFEQKPFPVSFSWRRKSYRYSLLLLLKARCSKHLKLFTIVLSAAFNTWKGSKIAYYLPPNSFIPQVRTITRTMPGKEEHVRSFFFLIFCLGEKEKGTRLIRSYKINPASFLKPAQWLHFFFLIKMRWWIKSLVNKWERCFQFTASIK